MVFFNVMHYHVVAAINIFFSICFFEKDWLFEHVQDQLYILCKDLYGCRVIQCILASGSVTHKDEVFQVVLQNPESYITDRYGNYVVQHIISAYLNVFHVLSSFLS